MRFELIPVKRDADPMGVGRNSAIVFDDQWPGDIHVNRKAVHLEPAGIGLGRDQTHMQLLHSVAANGEVILPG